MAIKDLIAIPIEKKTGDGYWMVDDKKKQLKRKQKVIIIKKNLKSGDGYWMAADSGGARRWGPPPW